MTSIELLTLPHIPQNCRFPPYPIIQGRLYSSLPGQSASLMAIGSVTAPLAKLFPFLIGFFADQVGLQTAMWILILGPVALLIGLHRQNTPTKVSSL